MVNSNLFKAMSSIPLLFVSSLYGEWAFGQIGKSKYTSKIIDQN